jgi:hypothetical protein
MRWVRYPVLSSVRYNPFRFQGKGRTSFSMSFSTLGFSAISMYTVPTTQQSSPCLTSSTRSTKVAFCPPSFLGISISLYCCVRSHSDAYRCIPQSRATHPRPSASPSSSIALTVGSTCRRTAASSVVRCPVVVRIHVVGCTPKGFETVRAAHPHCCSQYLYSRSCWATYKGSPLSITSSDLAIGVVKLQGWTVVGVL